MASPATMQVRGAIGALGMAGMVTWLMGMATGSPAALQMQLFLGAGMMALYVARDTQRAIAAAAAGAGDAVTDALVLFQDFFGLLVRILVMLSNKERQRDRRRGGSNNKDRSRSSRR